MRAQLLRWTVWMLVCGAAFAAPLKADLIDLNTATFAQLRALPGMGDEYVRRVVAGRPYSAKNQLVTRGVLPQAEYERIATLVVAHRVKAADTKN